jgi:hypothetical protein
LQLSLTNTSGILATDVVAAYGAQAISGSILFGAIPYRSMHPEVAHPIVVGLIPGLLSSDSSEFYKTASEFPLSCVADGFDLPAEDFFTWAGLVAIQVSRKFHITALRTEY